MENNTQKINHRKFEGLVVSNKMEKTIVVVVNRLKEHSRYKKRIKVTTRFKAHDENKEAHIGDYVLIEETRPISKDKRWKLVKILVKSNPEQIVEEAEAKAEVTVN
jgi:small subunit ribosomal protein S17